MVLDPCLLPLKGGEREIQDQPRGPWLPSNRQEREMVWWGRWAFHKLPVTGASCGGRGDA